METEVSLTSDCFGPILFGKHTLGEPTRGSEPQVQDIDAITQCFHLFDSRHGLAM